MPGGGIGGNFGNQGGFTGGPRFPSGPIIERIWKCTGCGAELGRGGTRPSMDICPGCNARIINGPSGGRVNPGPGFNPGPAFNPDPVVINPPAFNPPPAPVVHPFARQNFNPAPSSKGFGFGSTDGSDAAVWIILATLGGVGIVAGILIGVGRSMRF